MNLIIFASAGIITNGIFGKTLLIPLIAIVLYLPWSYLGMQIFIHQIKLERQCAEKEMAMIVADNQDEFYLNQILKAERENFVKINMDFDIL